MTHPSRRMSSSEGRGKPIKKKGTRTTPCTQTAPFSGRLSAAQTRPCPRTREVTQRCCSPSGPPRGHCASSGLHVLRTEAECAESTSPAGPRWQPRQASRSDPRGDVLPLACEFQARPWSTVLHGEPGYEASASTWK